MFGLSYKLFAVTSNIRTSLLFIIVTCINFSVVIGQSEAKNRINCVVIDAGHGGKDPGAKGSKHYEKDIVLSVALKLGDYIKNNMPDVKVIFTRDSDVFIPLHERADIANKNQADVFISIHCNSNPNKTPFGAETFVMGLTKTADNLEVAKFENSVILKEDNFSSKYEGFDNSPEAYIMLSLMQNTHIDQSLTLASYVQSQFKEKANRFDRGVKQAGFLVLWKTAMPSILIETGFLSNLEEERYLASSQGQDYLASSIYRAFRDYKNVIENRSIYVLSRNNPGAASSSDSFTINPEPIAVQPENNPVYYMVQISSSKKKIPLNAKGFKGIKNIEEHKSTDNYKYTVGRKTNYNDIVEFCKTIKNTFPDAFIVALKDGKIVPAKKVLNEIKN